MTLLPLWIYGHVIASWRGTWCKHRWMSWTCINKCFYMLLIGRFTTCSLPFSHCQPVQISVNIRVNPCCKAVLKADVTLLQKKEFEVISQFIPHSLHKFNCKCIWRAAWGGKTWLSCTKAPLAERLALSFLTLWSGNDTAWVIRILINFTQFKERVFRKGCNYETKHEYVMSAQGEGG